MTEASPAGITAGGPIMKAEDVDARLRELARVPVLLVACDYDGTLAPITDNPDEARPTRESVAAAAPDCRHARHPRGGDLRASPAGSGRAEPPARGDPPGG